jgi:hypothetical protein
MITYRGDRFVKGKKFRMNEQVITFITKSKKGFIFESAGSKITVDEKTAKTLKESGSNDKK